MPLRQIAYWSGEKPVGRAHGQRRHAVRLLEAVRGFVGLRIRGAEPVVPDLSRLPPSAEERQCCLPVEQPWGNELALDAFVARWRNAAAHIQRVVRAQMAHVAGAHCEAATRIRALEVGVHLQAGREHRLRVIHVLLGLVRHVWVELGGFLRLRPLEGRRSRIGIGGVLGGGG